MWVPRSEMEIRQALDNGLVRETGAFDAKEALPRPGKNKDLAKDICAMTVDGGVLLYGVGGDDGTRPDATLPFDLAGAAERIDQVAQSGIAESPQIEIHDVLSDAEPGKGYLVVVVPPSPRAPHMLTIDGDNRYWGRGETGNRILSEGEVARLYERRERWNTDRAAVLAKAATEMPFNFEDPVEQVGPMLVLARPVAAPPDLLLRIPAPAGFGHMLGRQVPEIAVRHDVYPDQGTSGLGQAFQTTPRGANRWLVARDKDLSFPYQAFLDVQASGELRYWHSPVINGMARRDGEERLLLMERSVTRAVYQLLATAGDLYGLAGFRGAVDVGVAVLHIEHAQGASRSQHMFDTPPTYGAPSFFGHARAVVSELDGPRALTRTLLAPLFAVVSVPGYDPFNPQQA